MQTPLKYESSSEFERIIPSRIDLAVVAMRLLGIWLGIQLVSTMSFYLPLVAQAGGSFANILPALAPIILMVAAVGALLFAAEPLARYVLPAPAAASEQRAALTRDDLQAMLLAVVGVWIVATAVPDLTSVLWQRAYNEYRGGAVLIQPVMSLIIGALLFVQGRGLVQLWHRIRK